ncbi:MAG: response regulator [Alphaproteobacteria bacterium]|nr:response regulator [Alphaproteobacteria bacterium]
MPEQFLRKKRFLIVDDDQSTVDIVREVLNHNGAYCAGVIDSGQVMSLLLSESFDGVILDRYMPEIDGHELLLQIKDEVKTRHLPVIMLTGEKQVDEIRQSLNLGASGYVVKPFTPKSFLLQLKKIIN